MNTHSSFQNINIGLKACFVSSKFIQNCSTAKSGYHLNVLHSSSSSNFSSGKLNKYLFWPESGQEINISLRAAFGWEDIILKVSLVGDVPCWVVSGHHKGRTI